MSGPYESNWLVVLSHSQHRQEGLLRNIDLPNAFHAFLAFFLFFQEFALAGDIAAVALGNDVLADGAYGLARDHFGADGRLDGNFEHLPRNQFAHLADQRAAALIGEILVDDN